MKAYLYFIRNKVTRQFYIGCRYSKKIKSIESDWLHNYFTSSIIVKRQLITYGITSFEWLLIPGLEEEVKRYENAFIQMFKLHPLCLNRTTAKRQSDPKHIQKLRDAGCYEWDEEKRNKQREIANKIWADSERRKKASEKAKNIWADTERRKKQSEISKQKWADPEYRSKLKAAQQKRRAREAENRNKK